MTEIARKPKWYDSSKIYCEYMQMIDNLHLYLIEKGLIVDQEQIEKIEYDWVGSYLNPRLTITIVQGQGPNFPRDVLVWCNEFDDYVENGFEL